MSEQTAQEVRAAVEAYCALSAARMNTECRVCGKPIRKGRDRIYYERGWQIHIGCPSTGGDAA